MATIESNSTREAKGGFCISKYLTDADTAHLIGFSSQTVTSFINELAKGALLPANASKYVFPIPAGSVTPSRLTN